MVNQNWNITIEKRSFVLEICPGFRITEKFNTEKKTPENGIGKCKEHCHPGADDFPPESIFEITKKVRKKRKRNWKKNTM